MKTDLDLCRELVDKRLSLSFCGLTPRQLYWLLKMAEAVEFENEGQAGHAWTNYLNVGGSLE